MSCTQGNRIFAARCAQKWTARLGWGIVEMSKTGGGAFLKCRSHEGGRCICKAEVLFFLACQEDTGFSECAAHKGMDCSEEPLQTGKAIPLPTHIKEALRFIRHYQTHCFGVCRKIATGYTVPNINTIEMPFIKYHNIDGVRCPVIGDFGDALAYQRPCICGSNMGRADRCRFAVSTMPPQAYSSSSPFYPPPPPSSGSRLVHPPQVRCCLLREGTLNATLSSIAVPIAGGRRFLC